MLSLGRVGVAPGEEKDRLGSLFLWFLLCLTLVWQLLCSSLLHPQLLPCSDNHFFPTLPFALQALEEGMQQQFLALGSVTALYHFPVALPIALWAAGPFELGHWIPATTPTDKRAPYFISLVLPWSVFSFILQKKWWINILELTCILYPPKKEEWKKYQCMNIVLHLAFALGSACLPAVCGFPLLPSVEKLPATGLLCLIDAWDWVRINLGRHSLGSYIQIAFYGPALPVIMLIFWSRCFLCIVISLHRI